MINGHGGNVQAIHDATQPFWVQRQILIPSFYLWRVGYGLLPGIVGEEKAKLVSGHGADPLTSVAMHLFPHLMRPELTPDPEPLQQVMGMPATAFGVARFEGAEIAVPVSITRSRRRACVRATRGCARRRRGPSWSSS